MTIIKLRVFLLYIKFYNKFNNINKVKFLKESISSKSYTRINFAKTI